MKEKKKKKLETAETNQKVSQSLQVMISFLYFVGLNDLISLLAPSTDIRVLLNCMSTNLQAFIIEV